MGERFCILWSAHTTTDLEQCSPLDRFGNRRNDCSVHWLGAFSCIEVHHVYPCSPLLDKRFSHRNRILAINGAVGILALAKTNNLSAQKINSGIQIHDLPAERTKFVKSARPAVADFSG